jgi:hypothetical protein
MVLSGVQDLLITFGTTIIVMGVMWVLFTIDDLKSDIRHNEIDIRYNKGCIDDLRSELRELKYK